MPRTLSSEFSLSSSTVFFLTVANFQLFPAFPHNKIVTVQLACLLLVLLLQINWANTTMSFVEDKYLCTECTTIPMAEEH